MGGSGPGKVWRARLDLLLLAVLALVAVGFLIVYGARPTLLLTVTPHDDALFIRLARSLTYGEWLGPYNQLTLAKGIGFPAFLALVNTSGLGYSLALGLFHLVCVGFLAAVIWRAFGSRFLGVAVFLLLLFLPKLHFGDLMRVFRDFFYMSLTLALIAAVLAVVTGRGLRPALAAVVAGVLGAWFWLTREEGVWLLPTLGLLALVPLLRAPSDAADAPLRVRLRRLAPVAAAFGVGAGCILLYGTINLAVYGRFVINEIKDPAFQGAMDALQEASAPYARTKMPVPLAARQEIYKVSPAFASVRSPVLDGPLFQYYSAYPCGADPRMCGDIAGGWFSWYFRDAVALQGHHESPAQAAAFYRQLEREVRAACRDGRLSCQPWNVPFVPPMRPDEVGAVMASMRALFDQVTFATPVWAGGGYSDLSARDGPELYRFLNRPPILDVMLHRRFEGFIPENAERFSVRPQDPWVTISHDWVEGIYAVSHVGPAALGRQWFLLDVRCRVGAPCAVDLVQEGQPARRVDLAGLQAGPLEGTELQIEYAGPNPKRYRKQMLLHHATNLSIALKPFYRWLALAGMAAFVLVCAIALIRRRIELGALVAAALFTAVAARIVILALVDALSFPAADHVYSLAAVPLVVVASLLSLHELGRQALLTRRRALP